MHRIISELRRRNVFRVAAVYGVTGWLIAQAVVVLETSLGLPDWIDASVVTLLLLGFPVAVVLAWAFELTPDGFKPTDTAEVTPRTRINRKRGLNIALVMSLFAAISFIVLDKTVFSKTSAPNTLSAATVRAQNTVAKAPSIAVLPFLDLSQSGDQIYFGDGIAEELLNLLAQVDGLRVASRTSAFSFRDGTTSVTDIGKALNVAHVLEGSIRKAGDQVRITAQLIDAQTDEHLWSETFDRALSAENLFAIQDEIAGAIVGELRGQLFFTARDDLPTRNTQSYQLYLSGKTKLETRRQDDILSGIEDLKAAVVADPDFAGAFVSLGRAYKLGEVYADLDPPTARRLALDALDTAQALDPDHPDLIVTRAWNGYDRADVDPQTLVPLFEAAIARNPNNADALRGLSNIKGVLGQYDQAQSLIDKALVLDPQSRIMLLNAGQLAMQRNRPREAERFFLRLLKIDPSSALARQSLAQLVWEDGRIAEAHRIAKSGETEPALRAVLSSAYERLGLLDQLDEYDRNLSEGYRAFLNADIERVKNIARTMEAKTPYSSVTLVKLIDDSEVMRDIFSADEIFRNLLTGPDPIGGSLIADAGLAFEHAFKETRPEQAAIVRGKIDAFYDQFEPDDFINSGHIYDLARWHARRGRPEQMYASLDAMIARNTPLAFKLQAHDFDAYRGEMRFRKIVRTMDEIILLHRTSVLADLETDPEIWWQPEGDL